MSGRHLVHRDGDASTWPGLPRAVLHVCCVQLDLQQGRPIRFEGQHSAVSDTLRATESVAVPGHLPWWQHLPASVPVPRVPPPSSPRIDSTVLHARLHGQCGQYQSAVLQRFCYGGDTTERTASEAETERFGGHDCKPRQVLYVFKFFIIVISGVRLSPLGTAATTGLLYQPQMIDDCDCGEIGGMKIGRGNRSTRRKPTPAPLCRPQIPHDQTRARTWAAAVGSQRLTAWAMARHRL
jgi:hypothetical protein